MAEMDHVAPDLFSGIARSMSNATLARIIENANKLGTSSELEAAALGEQRRRGSFAEPRQSAAQAVKLEQVASSR